MSNSKSKYARLAYLVNEAKTKAHEAADGSDDGGTANLDKVVLSGLKGVRESSLKKAGIDCYKHWSYAGDFVLSGSFGQGDKNTLGIAAMRDYLKEHGVNCYVHHRMD